MSFHKSLTGVDLHAPSNEQVENDTGALIPKLTAVTFDGIGVYPRIRPALITDVVRGITQTDIGPASTGYVTTLGFMFNVNSASYSVGQKLYLGVSGALSSAFNGLLLATVLRSSATIGTLYVVNTGITAGDIAVAGFPPDVELELVFSVQYPKPYKEFIYNGTGDIVDFNVYSDSTKSVHIFNKHFVYAVNGDLTQIVVANMLTSASKTKDLAYDINGQMVSEQES